MKEKVLSCLNKEETVEVLRRKVMLALFDVGRLIIDDERKLHAFHNEIAELTRNAYRKIKRDVEELGHDEATTVAIYLGIDRDNSRPCSSLIAGLHELLTFMYGSESDHRVVGFMNRAMAIILNQYRLHYAAAESDGK